MKLLSSRVEVEQLSLAERHEMFDLMQSCYENVCWEAFSSDLEAKWLVIQVREPESGSLVGFSTQVMLSVAVSGTLVHALFSGDTVVLPKYWGDPALAHEWGQLALELIDRYQSNPLHWFLTSKGFRTYRYLPLFFHRYFPREKALTPKREVAIIDVLGKLVGGDRYDPCCQLIRATPVKDFVRPGISEPGLRPQKDPHVRFFMEQNPAYARGDELCCLAPLTRENFTRAAYRVINARARASEAI